MNRRTMLLMSAAGGAGLLAARYGRLAPAAVDSAASAPAVVSIAEYTDAGAKLDVKQIPKVVKTAAE